MSRCESAARSLCLSRRLIAAEIVTGLVFQALKRSIVGCDLSQLNVTPSSPPISPPLGDRHPHAGGSGTLLPTR
jgi:hypothetical protein